MPESSDTYQLEFENQFVRIVHVRLGSEQIRRFDRPFLPTVRVDLNSTATIYVEGVLPSDAGRLLKGALREIWVELKAAPETDPLTLDAVRVDPRRYRVDFENDRVRVVRLRFNPREKGVMVSHPPRVLVTLTDVSVKLVFQDGRRDERAAPAGVAAWLDLETLQTENSADQPLEVVLVEPKPARGF